MVMHDELVPKGHWVLLDDTKEFSHLSPRDTDSELLFASNSSPSVEQAINHHVLLRIAFDTLNRVVAEEPRPLSFEVQHRLVSNLFATVVPMIAIVRAKVLTVRL